MKQRFTLKAVLFLAALLTGLHASAYDFESGGLYYNFNETAGTVSVTYNNDVKYSGDIVIPSTVVHDGITYTVTGIGEVAFGRSGITSVKMPNTITTIRYSAFENSVSLTEIEIPESVTTIEDMAFEGCSGINKPVVIPDGVKGNFASNLFRNCTNLPSLTIGTGITVICSNSLQNCPNLKELIIKDSDEPLEVLRDVNTNNTGFETVYVGRNFGRKNGNGEFYEGIVFIDVPSLKSVTFGDKVTAIYDYTLNRCDNLESITFGSGLKSIGSQVVHCMKLTSIEFPSGLESIGDYAFGLCGITGEVVLPDALTSLGEGAFDGCTGITSFTVGTGLTEFSLTSIQNCTGLKEVIFKDSETPIVVDGSEVNTSFAIETAHIGRDISAVINGRGLYSLFEDCTTLRNVTIGDNVTALCDYAFDGCTGLTSIDIPDGVTKIGTSAFSRCTGLTSLTLPDGVTEVGSSAFAASGLRSIVLPDGIKELSYTFSNCADLTSVTLPDGLVSLWGYTFWNCTNLKNIALPDGVTEIGSYAFEGCTGLESATLSKELTIIEENAFHDCSNLATIAIPDKVETIMYYAFNGCSNLATVTLGNSLKTIEYGCFEDCEKIAEITFPASLQEIEEGAFGGCTALMTINVLTNVLPELEEDGFDTKQYLRANVYVPKGTLDAYIASSWGNFANLHDTLDPSAVSLVENDGIGIRVVDGNIVVEGIAGGANVLTLTSKNRIDYN